MEQIKVTLSVNQVAAMLVEKMKSSPNTAQHIIRVLDAEGVMTTIMDVINNGIPKPKYPIGANMITTDTYYDGDKEGDDRWQKIGACTIIGFTPSSRYNGYEIEYMVVDDNGESLRRTANVGESSLSEDDS